MCYGTEDNMEGRNPRSLSDLRAAAKENAAESETANMEAQRKYKRDNSYFGRVALMQEEMARRQKALDDSVGPPVFQLNQNLPTKKSPQKAVLKIGRKSSVKTGSSKGRTGSTGSLRTPKTTINI